MPLREPKRLLGGATAHIDIAPGVVICEPLALGRGKRPNHGLRRGRRAVLCSSSRDVVMIRMMVADMLEELGYSVAAEAGEINEAIRLANRPNSISPFSTSTSMAR